MLLCSMVASQLRTRQTTEQGLEQTESTGSLYLLVGLKSAGKRTW